MRISSRGFIVASLLVVLISACTRNEPARDAARAQIPMPAEGVTQQRVESGFGITSASLVGTGSLTEEIAEEAEDSGSNACTEDCSEVGYTWAEQNGVTDPNDCGGKSNSFFEGCMAYTAEQRQDRDTRDD